MQRNQTRKVIRATQVVQAVIDKSWIPEDIYDKWASGFSVNVLWQFIPSWDSKDCRNCNEIALGVPFIAGNQLRSQFPYLEVRDENTINANVHPNCRCKLYREVEGEQMEVVSKEEAKQAFITKKP
jgi:hypothetical protein